MCNNQVNRHWLKQTAERHMPAPVGTFEGNAVSAAKWALEYIEDLEHEIMSLESILEGN